MKATGEVMGIGSNLEECLLKSVRSLETGVCHFYMPKFDTMSDNELKEYLTVFKDDNIFAVAELLRRGTSVAELHEITKITPYFIESIEKIVAMENKLKYNKDNLDVLKEAKKMGFGDKFIAKLWDKDEIDIFAIRKENNIYPVYKFIDTCAAEYDSYVPYFYSTYEFENESIVTKKKKIVVFGAFISYTLWVIYDICVMSYSGALTDGIIVLSNLSILLFNYNVFKKRNGEEVSIKSKGKKVKKIKA
jgi:carbamoyl-phosphate synthase large subunit